MCGIYSINKKVKYNNQSNKYNWKEGVGQYIPVLYVQIIIILGKARLNLLKILLDSGLRSSIVLGKHTQKL